MALALFAWMIFAFWAFGECVQEKCKVKYAKAKLLKGEGDRLLKIGGYAEAVLLYTKALEAGGGPAAAKK